MLVLCLEEEEDADEDFLWASRLLDRRSRSRLRSLASLVASRPPLSRLLELLDLDSSLRLLLCFLLDEDLAGRSSSADRGEDGEDDVFEAVYN